MRVADTSKDTLGFKDFAFGPVPSRRSRISEGIDSSGLGSYDWVGSGRTLSRTGSPCFENGY